MAEDTKPSVKKTEPEAPPPAHPSEKDGKAFAVRMTHGTYVGPGCPDKDKRKDTETRIFAGSDYDHDHPAQVGEVIYLGKGLPAQRAAQRMIDAGICEAL